jgi:hypothetical protein
MAATSTLAASPVAVSDTALGDPLRGDHRLDRRGGLEEDRAERVVRERVEAVGELGALGQRFALRGVDRDLEGRLGPEHQGGVIDHACGGAVLGPQVVGALVIELLLGGGILAGGLLQELTRRVRVVDLEEDGEVRSGVALARRLERADEDGAVIAEPWLHVVGVVRVDPLGREHGVNPRGRQCAGIRDPGGPFDERVERVGLVAVGHDHGLCIQARVRRGERCEVSPGVVAATGEEDTCGGGKRAGGQG